MSIQKDVWVKCDECGEMGFASHTSKQARREARQNGWAFRKGKDYCPNCAPTKRAFDVAVVCANCNQSEVNHPNRMCGSFEPPRK